MEELFHDVVVRHGDVPPLSPSAPANHDRNGQENEFDVFPQGLALEIGDVKLDHFLECDPAASIDLPGAGQPWFSREPLPVVCAVEFDFVGDRGTWANQRHFAAQDVEELGQFVDAGLADEAANARDAGVVVQLVGEAALVVLAEPLALHVAFDGFAVNLVIPIDVHGAEFEHHKFGSVQPYPLLAIKDRPFRVQANEDSDDDDGEAERKENKQGEEQIKDTLGPKVPRLALDKFKG